MTNNQTTELVEAIFAHAAATERARIVRMLRAPHRQVIDVFLNALGKEDEIDFNAAISAIADLIDYRGRKPKTTPEVEGEEAAIEAAIVGRCNVMVALACSDDFDLDQEGIAVRTRKILREWRAYRLTHDGDCTNVAHTCQLCLCENYEKRALAFIAAFYKEDPS